MPVQSEGRQLAGANVKAPRPIRMMLLGSILGWLIGILRWAGLVLFVYGPTLRVADNASGWQEKEIARQLSYALACGIPWGMAGAIAGAVGCVLRGYGPPVGAMIGLGLGGGLALIIHGWDGWLAYRVWFHSITCTIIGLACGVVYQCDFAPARKQDATPPKEE